LDDNAETIDADRLGWESATVQLRALPKGTDGDNDNSSIIHLRNIDGKNTQLNISNGPLLYLLSYNINGFITIKKRK
jgi:hypothetical protein